MKEVKKFIETSSDEELRNFILHCEMKLHDADPDIRSAAFKALKRAREERAARDLLRR